MSVLGLEVAVRYDHVPYHHGCQLNEYDFIKLLLQKKQKKIKLNLSAAVYMHAYPEWYTTITLNALGLNRPYN